MSNKGSTREIIVSKALEMFNAFGVEYVGVRELAKELQTKGGNITYYFATKNDLILELSNRLTASNGEIINQKRDPDLYSFLDMNRRLYFNQYKYRSFFISLPLWLQQDDAFARNYRKMLDTRRASFTQELRLLVDAGYLLPLPWEELDPMLDAIAATSRLWICEATIDGLINNETIAVHTYLKRLAGLLKFVAAKKGKTDIKRFLEELK